MAYTDGRAVGINSAMVRFLHEWQRGIKERRGGPLDKAGVRAAVSPKEERRERMGGPV